MKLVVNNIYIFSLKEKKAYHIKLEDGINFITSCKKNGNKRGKSVIMKSIYSTLGADCSFEDSWEFSNKTTILDVNIDNRKLYFFRADKYFRIVDDQYKEIFSTNHRTELSGKLKELFNFHIELPNRNNELEITPPAFMYLLSYVDQNGLDCTNFSSFNNLGQYPNYKKYTLLSHFGIFNQEYYELDKKLKEINDAISNNLKEINTMEKLMEKLDNELNGNDYSLNIDSLQKEINLTKDEYKKIVNNLNTTKNMIIKLENSKLEVENLLEELTKDIKDNENNFKKYENETCPYCKSHITPFEFSYKYFDKNDDYLFIRQSMMAQLNEMKRNIQIEENKYQNFIKDLDNYNQKIKAINSNIDDVLKHKGFIEMRNKLNNDIYEIKQKNISLTEELSNIQKKIKEYNNLKNQVDNEYFNLMSESIEKLDLQEIKPKSIKKIDNVFKVSGSTTPAATYAWYLSLLKIKSKFNPNAIKFPLVFDSPNNAELDDQNITRIFKYIFNNVDKTSQIIVSTIEFKKEMYSEFDIKNVVTLENEQYHLLNEEDYNKFIELYKKVTNL